MFQLTAEVHQFNAQCKFQSNLVFQSHGKSIQISEVPLAFRFFSSTVMDKVQHFSSRLILTHQLLLMTQTHVGLLLHCRTTAFAVICCLGCALELRFRTIRNGKMPMTHNSVINLANTIQYNTLQYNTLYSVPLTNLF